MAKWNTSAVGHDMRPSVILLFQSDKVVLNQQYCVRHATWSTFLSCVVINYSKCVSWHNFEKRTCFLGNPVYIIRYSVQYKVRYKEL